MFEYILLLGYVFMFIVIIVVFGIGVIGEKREWIIIVDRDEYVCVLWGIF